MKQFRIELGVDVAAGLSDKDSQPAPAQPTNRTAVLNAVMPWLFLAAFIFTILVLRGTE